jgi:hypothetical protein
MDNTMRQGVMVFLAICGGIVALLLVLASYSS